MAHTGDSPTTPVNPRAVRLREAAVVFLGYTLVVILFTYPLVLNLRRHLPGTGDSHLNAYIQAWVTHALLTHPTRLFDANFYYPAHNTLALSENMLGTQPFFAPIYVTTGNPALAYNIVLLLDFILSAASMYLLVRLVTGSTSAGAISGLIFSLCPARFSQIGHMQLLSMEWTPLVIFSLLMWMRKPERWSLLMFCAALLMQILSSIYLGYMSLIITAGFLAAAAVVGRSLMGWRRLWLLALGGLIVGILLIPVLLPYHKLQAGPLKGSQYLPFIASASASPLASYLNGAGVIYKGSLDHFRSLELDWEKKLFVGFTALTLSFFAFPILRKRNDDMFEVFPGGQPEPVRILVLGAGVVAVCSYVLSLGPYLKVHDHPTSLRLPFFWLRQMIPGMENFRAPSRFGISMMFGIAILAGTGLKNLLSRFAATKRLTRSVGIGFAICVICLVAVEYKWPSLGVNRVIVPGEVPPEYVWLENHHDGAPVIEFPVTPSGNFYDPYEEAAYDYASSFHWHPIVNGYSGYAPTISLDLLRLSGDMPSPVAVSIFRSLGVRYAVLHKDRMSSEEIASWERALHANKDLVLLQDWGASAIIALQGPLCASLGSLDPQLPEIAQAGQPFAFVYRLRETGGCWASPFADQAEKLAVTWVGEKGQTLTERSFPISLPIYVRGAEGGPSPAVLLGRSPVEPGTYQLKFRSFGNVELNAPPVTVTLVASAPSQNSENDREDLRAQYKLLTSQRVVDRGSREYVEFEAKNTGKDLWLHGARHGGVRLGYEWLDHAGKPSMNGRLDLPYDVFPGTSFTFQGEIEAPTEPGEYWLKLELVSEMVAWFHDVGTLPIRVPVSVVPQKAPSRMSSK